MAWPIRSSPSLSPTRPVRTPARMHLRRC
ncbi:hypothetical protein ID866_6618 [Astraeus odoratus]|nr:hypothetical protein ID866_6618 [Astraeus odoratus]